MSLLMDALKKAEREKNRALSKTNPEDISESEVSSEQTYSSDNTYSTSNTSVQSDQALTNEPAQSDQKDENWAFDTGELELEPLAQKSKSSDENYEREILDNDVTIKETFGSGLEEGSSGTEQHDLTLKSSAGSQQDFDHDATLPSERAIQSSLKDYFEASQSITMDQSSVTAAATPDITEHSVINTSPLDTSATHVSAHTIFTASQSRQANTGLARYALFGTLFLAAGLGGTALYYSYVTPKAIDMPATLPTVATMIESEDLSQNVEVDVTGVETVLQVSPISIEKGEAPVLAEVNQDELPLKIDDQPEIEQTHIDKQAEAKTKVDQTIGAGEVEQKQKPELEQVVIKVPEVKKEPEVTPESVKQKPVEALASTSFEQSTPAPKTEHEVVNFSHLEQAKSEPEESIIRKDELYQTAVLKGGYVLNDPVNTSTQPIDVMSSEDFSKGLKMPRSAIRITKGQTHRASNSDLMNAYQAYQAGDFQTAKSLYRKILNRRVDNRDARLGIAAIAVMEGNYETANRHYQYLRQLNPQDQVVNAALFNLQGNSGVGVNESRLKLSLDQNPGSPQIHFSLGSFYAKQSRWPEAQQAFFDAYSIDNSNADYAYNLAVSLDQMGQAKTALSHYRTALKLADKTTVSFNTSRVLARIQKLSGIVKH